MNKTPHPSFPRPSFPHHRLVAYPVALSLVVAVRDARIRDAKLRDEALRAVKSVVCNIGEGAGRVTPADKRHKFTIARGEAIEAVAAIELAHALGDIDDEQCTRCLAIASRLVALLTGLTRR